MLIKGTVFKLILGGLFILGLSAAAAGVIYFLYVKPYPPTILNVTVDNIAGSCEPVITWQDNSQNEDGFRLYRWNPPTTTSTLINIFAVSPGKGMQYSFTDSPLKVGTYFYKISSFNKFGESYSNITSVAVTNTYDCSNVPIVNPATLPMNPVVVSLSIINDCSVRISFNDNSTNEQGFKIYRDEPYTNPAFILLKTLGAHTGIPDTYDDNTKLPIGTYIYRILAYNQNGESASSGGVIDVTSVCNPTLKSLPTTAALALPTLQKLSGGTCNWVAAVNVYLRKGPDVAAFDRLVLVSAGQGFPIVGQSQDGQFWAVQVGPGVLGYITKSEKYSLTNGDCSIVPPLRDPVPPVVAPTPTNNSGGKHKATSTPCPVGAVCP